MNSRSKAKKPGLHGFRAKLLAAMMLVVSALTLAGLLLTQRKVAADAERGFRRDFQGALAALNGVQEVRQAVLAERCRTLVQRPRIHAALEDDALDLLYLNAADELRDVMDDGDESSEEMLMQALHARFYRSGHGLGLNLAQELARLHGGELRLVRSDETWTEFEVRFRLMKPVAVGSVEFA